MMLHNLDAPKNHCTRKMSYCIKQHDPSFILIIWQTVDLWFRVYKKKKTEQKESNFITITAHFLGACSQTDRALPILMAHWSACSWFSRWYIFQPVMCITRGTSFFLATWDNSLQSNNHNTDNIHNIWIFSSLHRQKGRILRFPKHCKTPNRWNSTHALLINLFNNLETVRRCRDDNARKWTWEGKFFVFISAILRLFYL